MENAQLIALSRQLALQKQMEVVANNIANINTTGFKAEMLLHEEFVMPVARDKDFALPDQQLSFTQDWATIHDLTPGSIAQTGNLLTWFAGDGFLVVDTPEGERWTRAGALQIDVRARSSPSTATRCWATAARSPSTLATPTSRSTPPAPSRPMPALGRLRLVEFETPQERPAPAATCSGGTPLAAVPTRVVRRDREIERLGITETPR